MPHGVVLVLGVVLLACVCLLLMFASRVRALDRRVGSFPCRVQRGERPSSAWAAGVAQYGVGRIVWYRRRSLSPRPVHTWTRPGLEVLEHVRLDPSVSSPSALTMLRCRCGDDEFELTLSRAAAAGLTSWLEGGPAGAYPRLG